MPGWIFAPIAVVAVGLLFWAFWQWDAAVPRITARRMAKLVAVGQQFTYVFDYGPKGFRPEIKRQVACWSRGEISVVAEGWV